MNRTRTMRVLPGVLAFAGLLALSGTTGIKTFAQDILGQSTVIYNSSSSPKDNIVLGSWGSGSCRLTSQPTWQGDQALEVTARDLYAGGRIDFKEPLDLTKPFNDPKAYLQIAANFGAVQQQGGFNFPGFGGGMNRGPGMMMPGAGRPGAGGQMRPGMGGQVRPGAGGRAIPGAAGVRRPGAAGGMMGPGAMMGGPGMMGPGMMAPGAGAMRGPGGMMAGPAGMRAAGAPGMRAAGGAAGRAGAGRGMMGGPGGMMGGGPGMMGPGGTMGARGNTRNRSSLPLVAANKVRVMLVFDSGQTAECLLDRSGFKPTADGWTTLGVPVSVIKSQVSQPSYKVKRIVISGDGTEAFYVGDIRTVEDSSALQAYAGDDKEVARNDDVTFQGDSTPGATGVKYSWDFNATDGIQEEAVGPVVHHKFVESGDYVVTLTVSDLYGQKTPATSTVKVKVNP